MPLIGWQPPSHQVESSQAPAPQAECETATGSLPIATGPPHPCGGSLHFTVLYLLTRAVDKPRQLTSKVTLRAGLDQLAKFGPFVCEAGPPCAPAEGLKTRGQGPDVPQLPWAGEPDFSSTSVPDGPATPSTTGPEASHLAPYDRLGDMLDETARRTLDLEASWWRHAGTKNAAIRAMFREEPAAYHQRLGQLLDDPGALDHAPVLVRRLRRQRARRLGARSGRRLAG